MAVVCVLWADVEGAPTDGKNQLVGDMLCLGGSLLIALVTVLQEKLLTTITCGQYLAILGMLGSAVTVPQTYFMEYEEILNFQWFTLATPVQYASYCSVQTIFQMLQSFMLRDAGAILLHLSFLSADYYTVIAGMYFFQFKFHGLYFLSYMLAMVGVFLFSSRPSRPSPTPATPPPLLPQLVHDSVQTHDNVSMEYTVPNLDCIPIEALEPPMSRDTTFTSFLGHSQPTANGTLSSGHANGNTTIREPC